MFAIDLESAKRIGIGVVVGLVVLSFLAAWLIKSVVMKLITIGLLLALAFAVWTQRNALQDCADQLQEKARVGDFSSTTCTFFGFDVTVPDLEDALSR
jgi:uncharacterized membrane protein YfcA